MKPNETITSAIRACMRAAALCAAVLAPSLRADTDSPQGGSRSPMSLPFPLSSIVGNDYRLQPYDLVVFELYDEPDVTTQQRISGRGDIHLPMIGDVQLNGLTVRSAELAIQDLYRTEGYFKNPQAILYAARHAERMISVLGQVNRPDRIELSAGIDHMGLAQAIALAGGLTRIAKATSVQISRTGPDGHEQRYVVDLDAYLSAERVGKARDEFQLQADDIVFVPERTL